MPNTRWRTIFTSTKKRLLEINEELEYIDDIRVGRESLGLEPIWVKKRKEASLLREIESLRLILTRVLPEHTYNRLDKELLVILVYQKRIQSVLLKDRMDRILDDGLEICTKD